MKVIVKPLNKTHYITSHLCINIYYDHQIEKEEGNYLISTYSALCNLNGVMQYPELEYTAAGSPYNQYGCLERDFVRFSGEDEDYIENYLDMSTNKLVDFPEGTSKLCDSAS